MRPSKALLRCLGAASLCIAVASIAGTAPTALARSLEGVRAYSLWMRLSEADREAEMEAIASAYVYGRNNGVDALSDVSMNAAEKLAGAERDRVRSLLYKSYYSVPVVAPIGPSQIGVLAREVTALYTLYPNARSRTPGLIFSCIMEAEVGDLPIIPPAEPKHSEPLAHAANCVSRMR